MAMSYKIIPTPAKDSLPEYPCLKVLKSAASGDLYILFSWEDTGVVVAPNKEYKLGDYKQNWGEHNFELFDGTVTLENK